MQLVEMMVVMGKDRMIQLPEEEVKVMGMKEGDELCLSYLVDDRMEGKVNGAGEHGKRKLFPSQVALIRHYDSIPVFSPLRIFPKYSIS